MQDSRKVREIKPKTPNFNMDQSGSGGIVGPSENLNDMGQFYVEDAVASETTGKPRPQK